MAELCLKAGLLILVCLIAHVALGQPGSFCSDTGSLDVGAVTVCSMESLGSCQTSLLAGEVLLMGNGSSTWDLGANPLRFKPDARVTLKCLRVLLDQPASNDLQLRPADIKTLQSPPFLQSPRGRLPVLTMRDTEIVLTCDLLREWQDYLCSVRLPGRTTVQGNVITVQSWIDGDTVLERVSLTCDPGPKNFSPACSMAVVEQVSDILEASSRLQDPDLPLVLTVSQGLSFSESVWPVDGLRITANVTLSATVGSTVIISFGLRTVLFTVDSKSSATAFLSFRGCILLDLPLSYLPMNHPRRPFGILSTSLWPVYREEVAMGLYNCTLILTQDEFKFWSFWLTILVSPIPSVSALGNWTFSQGVQLQPSGDDFIQLTSYFGRYTTLSNVRYQVSNEQYPTLQRKNILQITNQPSVPPTVVFQTRDCEDLLNALMSTSSSAAADHGQYIILTGNLTMVDEAQWPSGGVPVRYPTTITTWPSSWVAFDFKLQRNAFLILPPSSSSVIIKNIVLLNLAAGPSDAGDDITGLTTGLWAFNYSNWRNSDQQRLALERVVMVVSQEEVDYYISTAVTWQRTDTWISSFEVESYDKKNRSWIQFKALATARFTAQSLNISNTIPDMFDSDLLNITTVTGWTRSSGGSTSDDTSKREVLLFALLAITLPTALGAALLTYVLLKRRRLSQLCRHGAAQKASSGDGEEDGSDGEEMEPKKPPKNEPSCCFPLQLRRSKFVNPLYDGAGRGATDIVLTGVLGPAALARSLGAVEAAAMPAPGTSAVVPETAAAAAGPIVAVDQDAAPDAPAGTRSGSGRSSRALHVLSAVPAELRQGGASTDGLAEAAAESRVSSLSESCVGGPGTRLLDGVCGSGGSQAAAAATAAAVACAAAAGSPYGHEAAATAAGSSGQVSELRIVPVAASAAVLAAPSSLPAGPSGPSGLADDDASAQQRALLARQESSRQAEPAPQNPRFVDVQHLDRLRREIGDRHLEVQHSLGWGGCGVVYKGVWKGLQVAVKTILLQGDGKQSQQFLTEAAISASLQHANIVTTYLYELRPLDEVDPRTSSMEIRVRSRSTDGVSLQDGERMSCWRLYIVQEFCELGTLKAAIDQGYFKGVSGGLPNLAFLLTMALDIASGLAHVHSKNVVHGDITVSNVLLQAHPGRPHGCIAKVADFGLSVKFEDGQSQGYHMYGGTPHYMAPERIRGVLSKRSDIYSMGVCLWELYCGTPPWRRNAAGAHHRGYGGTSGSSVDSGNNLPLHSFGDAAAGVSGGGGGGSDALRFPRSCPQEYSSLVLSCLSSDPQVRPTAAAVVATLQRLHRRYT